MPNLVLGGGGGEAGAYTIDQSLRFDDGDSAYLSRTPGSAGNRRTWTLSCWVKRGNFDNNRIIDAYSDTNNWTDIYFNTNVLTFGHNVGGSTTAELESTQVFRDISAWYHLVFACDTTQGTDSNRLKMYVNGSQVTAFGTANYPAENLETHFNNTISHNIGRRGTNNLFFDGYMAEFYWIDGTQLAASDFGELSSTTNQWKPLDSDDVKDAVTFGTNGFFQKYNSTELANSFTNDTYSDAFVPSSDLTVNYLVVAGGASGGAGEKHNYGGGGGGAGGLLSGTHSVTSGTSYPITVGAGGAAIAPSDTSGAVGNNGSNSVFSSFTAVGGGGGSFAGVAALAGGSGGGGQGGVAAGGAGTAGQGNDGGDADSYLGAGGGGAGGAGQTRSGTTGGAGGAGADHSGTFGTSYGVSGLFAGGGGGGYQTYGGGGLAPGAGGSGGGGAAGTIPSPPATVKGTDGTAATGGGGGGGSSYHSGTTSSSSGGSGAGGLGVVLIRYAGSSPEATGGTISTVDISGTDYQVHAFTNVYDDHTITANGDVKNVRGADLDTTYTTINAFTSTGADTWTCPAGVTSIELLVVAGGGGGSAPYYAGGGGAGGVIHDTDYTVVPGVVYDLSVGAGGTAGDATAGGDSVWNVNAEGSGITFTSDGGGRGGGGGGSNNGGSGGSGGGDDNEGGGGGGSSTQTSPSGATGYGNAGGASVAGVGGGGGGANAVGGVGVGNTTGGAGGAGKLFSGFVAYGTDSSNAASTGSNGGYFGGGAGGGSYNNTQAGGVGGVGGGGTGGGTDTPSNQGTIGIANTGGGGGGGDTNGGGKAGGSGIVLIAYSGTKPGSSSIEFDGTGDYLSVADGSDFVFGTGNFTLEAWINFSTVQNQGIMLLTDASTSDTPYFDYYGGALRFGINGIAVVNTYTWTPVAGAWHHVAAARSGSTCKLFIDGAEVDSDSNSTDFTSDGLLIGAWSSRDWDGYMDEIRISNSARYTAAFTVQRTQFTADANTKLLIHSDYTGGLGADSSGNFNNFAATNLVATDQMIDTPTNNWCTLDPLIGGGTSAYLSEGNLRLDPGGAQWARGISTFGATSGKWYFEVYVFSMAANGAIGVRNDVGLWDETGGPPGYAEWGPETGGHLYLDGLSDIGSVGSFAATDIVSMAVNMDDGEIQWFLNGAVLSGSGNVPVTLPTTTQNGFISYGACYTDKHQWNFGQDSSFSGTVTAQGNQDDNGKGDFYYAPPSGFLALCTDNLSAPEIALPGDNFSEILYTGDGSTRSLTGVGFQPDLLTIKRRDANHSWMSYDVLRGFDTGVGERLAWNNAEVQSDVANGLASFDSDGFSVGGATGVNLNTAKYAAYSWKGGGTGVSNGTGSITSTVSANTTAGFSLVKFAGDSADGATVGHGLTQAPEFVIVKAYDYASDWNVYSNPTGNLKYLFFNSTAAEATNNRWNDTTPSASVVTLGANEDVNNSSYNYIMYCFHSIEGYSKVGSYIGNANADGPFIYLGFRPAVVIFKNIERTTADGQATDWLLYDNKRAPSLSGPPNYNVNTENFWVNDNSSEPGSQGHNADFISNGFKIRGSEGSTNKSGDEYLYIAFADTPFKTANAR